MWAVLLPIMYVVEVAGQGCAAGSEAGKICASSMLQSKSHRQSKVHVKLEEADSEVPTTSRSASVLLGILGKSAAASHCTDNDAEIARLAKSVGKPEVAGCADAVGYCDQQSQVGDKVREICCATCGAAACADNDSEIARLAKSVGKPEVTGCADAVGYCDKQTQEGDKVREVCCATCAAAACTDDDAEIARLAQEYGEPDISGCADVGGYCILQSSVGDKVREVCCSTCATTNVPETSLPPPDSNDPVHLFLQGGQSECTGSASPTMLAEDGRVEYSKLVGSQEGVWFAGYSSPATSVRFFIANMKAGDEKNGFGPEVSFGQRVREATGARVLIVKYCMGGSSVKTNWNPSTSKNSWDAAKDDGTADFLLKSGGVDFSDKSALFVTWIYTARRATEALTAAGVDFQWKGIMWVQGQADSESTWEEFGRDTARVWDAARAALGVSDLPIVDTGSSLKHNLRSGKAYAAQIVKGSRASTIEFAKGSANPDSDCKVTPSNPCLDSTFFGFDVFNHFGYDPLFPAEYKPPGATSKTFRWFKMFPTNLHSEYEGMIAEGRMLADEYIRAFTSTPLPPDMAAEDVALLFPWPKCTPQGAKPSATKQCWMDLRTPS